MNRALLAFLVLIGLAAPVCAEPANTLQQLYQSIGHCLINSRGAPGGEITLLFSLRRDGGLIGRPRVTYARLPQDAAAQSRFVESVVAAFDHCMPAQITDALGGAIAGRPLTLRIVSRRHETDI